MMYRIVLSFLILAGLVLMPFSATALDLKDKELLLYLPFNEGKGKAMEDLSPHGNDAELVGDADWVDGKFGKALEFGQAGEVKAPYIELNEKSFTVTDVGQTGTKRSRSAVCFHTDTGQRAEYKSALSHLQQWHCPYGFLCQ